jgi:hypothetical protein
MGVGFRVTLPDTTCVIAGPEVQTVRGIGSEFVESIIPRFIPSGTERSERSILKLNSILNVAKNLRRFIKNGNAEESRNKT